MIHKIQVSELHEKLQKICADRDTAISERDHAKVRAFKLEEEAAKYRLECLEMKIKSAQQAARLEAAEYEETSSNNALLDKVLSRTSSGESASGFISRTGSAGLMSRTGSGGTAAKALGRGLLYAAKSNVLMKDSAKMAEHLEHQKQIAGVLL